MPQISKVDRGRAVGMHDSGLTQTNIGQRLWMHRTTIERLWILVNITGSIEALNSGRYDGFLFYVIINKVKGNKGVLSSVPTNGFSSNFAYINNSLYRNYENIFIELDS